MTYNFDPDKWYENELAFLKVRAHKGELSPEAFDRAVDLLDKKHDDMWDRLNNTYRISPESCGSEES